MLLKLCYASDLKWYKWIRVCKMDGVELEIVNQKYFKDWKCGKEIETRIAIEKKAFMKPKQMLKSKNLAKELMPE